MSNDLDLLIIGGYYGKCQYGGQIVSYLLALVDDSEGKSDSSRFISICRCGIGLSEEDRSILQSKLAPFLSVNNKRGRPPSGCKYLVTNSRYERPDVWVSKPEMSVVVQVSSEKRVYPTSTFKAGWTFRFPRIVRVRYDKCWSESLQLREFEEMVQIARLNGNSLFSYHKYDPIIKVSKRHKREQQERNSVVLSHFQSSIIAHGEEAHGHLDNMVFYICNLTTDINKAQLFAQIQEYGGKIAMNLSQVVTHVVASEPKGLHYKVAKSSEFDVIHISWLFSMLESKGILPILPRHYIYLSNKTTKTISESVDELGDPWFEPLEREDLFQIFQNMNSWCSSSSTSAIGKRVSLKLGRPWLSGIFQSCCLYFHKPIHSRNPDSQSTAILSLRRLQLEAEMQGASTSRNIFDDITHMVVYVPDGVKLSFKTILHSLSEPQRQVIWTNTINIVCHAWIEECIISGKRLESEPYNLRSDKELEYVLASNCIEVKSGPHSIFDKTVIQSNMGNSSVTENQSSSNIQSDTENRLGFDDNHYRRSSSKDKINPENFTAGARSEQQIDYSPGRHYDLSELKGIDNVGHSFDLHKDSADVVENMSQILLGVPSNFY
ncbi:DNA ligase 4 isoform X1 [Cryptomeria japonica]|uniref:DNA ligase 4 isoform X1 n=1 Tax=Cryptomeria japonica TaxID=3369 RepID=UPI0027DA1F94|nr:DNA ligase 4 isoform X1 [Cryptomeria japonica]